MNQSNFQNFNYSNYQPQPPEEPGLLEKIVGPVLAAKFRSPLFATGALLIAGVAFAGIIISGQSGDSDVAVPVVQAEVTAFKEQPSDPGGLSIPNQDSTVFSSLSNPQISGGDAEPAPVENLLAEDEPVDRLEAFAAEAQKDIEVSAREDEASQQVLNLIDEATGVDTSDTSESPEQVANIPSPKRVKNTVAPEDLLQKVEAVPDKPESLSKPGSAPETLEFVKNVLDKKDAKAEAGAAVASAASDAANAAANIQPAAGFSALAPGTHYVQLGSVKTASGASGEWGKLQKTFPAELSEAKYRVQRADLGERGVFYRIQAGPMSGESASAICDSIKAQKPGACLVTK